MAQTINFNENTDYNAAEATVKQMFSNLKASKCGGCGCKDDIDCSVSSLIVAMDINKGTNEARWKNNIKAAYKLLKLKCGC